MAGNALLWTWNNYRTLLAPTLYPGEEMDDEADEGDEKHGVRHIRGVRNEETGSDTFDVHFIPPKGFFEKGEDTQLRVTKTAPECTHRLNWNEP